MIARLLCCVFFLLETTSALMGQEPPTGPGLSASSSDCTLRISFKGKIRLAGGQPLFEARTPTITGLAGSPGLFSFRTSSRPIDVIMKLSNQAALVSFFLSPNGNQSDSGAQFLGFFFSDIPEFDKGVTLWRYKPWNS